MNAPLITDHVWRPVNIGCGYPKQADLITQCWYMNCRRPAREHARSIRGRVR